MSDTEQHKTLVRWQIVDDEYFMNVAGIIAWLEGSATIVRAMPPDMQMSAETVGRWLDSRIQVIRDAEAVRLMEAGLPPAG